MKHLIGLTLASAFVINVNAQSAADGEKLIQYGKYESAISVLKPLADKYPEAAYALGIAQLELNNVTDAKAAFALHPKDFRAQIGQAIILLRDNKSADGEKILETVVDGAKKKEWEKYKLAADAITYSEAGSTAKAVEWYQKAISINNENPEIHIAFGDLYLKRLNDGGEALTQYKAAINLNKGSKSVAYNDLGSLWIRNKNYENALENLKLAQEADPNNPLPYLQLAKAYDRSKQYQTALTNIEKYYQLSDKTYNDKIDYANILIASKSYDKATTILDGLLKSNVSEPTLYRALAYSQFETGKFDDAAKSMEQYYTKVGTAATITPEDYIYSGKIYAAMANKDSVMATSYFEKADGYFAKGIASDTSKIKKEIYSEIGNAYRDAGNWPGAAKYYGEIVIENPNASAYDYFNYGLYTYYAKESQKALDIFTKMAELYPEEGAAIYWQGRSAQIIDNKAETGLAEPFYVKWLAFEKEGYSPKDSEKIRAYEYLLYYYANKEKNADAGVIADKILVLDPTHKNATQMKEYLVKAKK